MAVREAMVTENTPVRLKMSYEEFLAWIDEDTRAEWVNGEVIIHMPPKNVHQNTVEFLYELLSLYVRLFGLGKMRLAPFEMKLWPGGPAREPDILFIATDNLERLTEERLVGPADLIVEVVSSDSVKRDREDKFKEYQTAGVREYWIVDPRPDKQRADFYRLSEAGEYELTGTEDVERVYSETVSGFWLRPSWLWQTGTLKPLTACLEIEGVAIALTREIERVQGSGKK